MRTIYAVTMWSGGMPARKWQTYEKPELLPQGTGIRFVCRDSKLPVELIGPVSVEEYESGKDDIEQIRDLRSEAWRDPRVEEERDVTARPPSEDKESDRLF